MILVAVNCAENARANLADGVEFADDGRLLNANWIKFNTTDPVIEGTCGV